MGNHIKDFNNYLKENKILKNADIDFIQKELEKKYSSKIVGYVDEVPKDTIHTNDIKILGKYVRVRFASPSTKEDKPVVMWTFLSEEDKIQRDENYLRNSIKNISDFRNKKPDMEIFVDDVENINSIYYIKKYYRSLGNVSYQLFNVIHNTMLYTSQFKKDVDDKITEFNLHPITFDELMQKLNLA